MFHFEDGKITADCSLRSNFPLQRMKQFSDILSKGFVPSQAWYSGWDLLRRLCFVLIALWVPSISVQVRLVS